MLANKYKILIFSNLYLIKKFIKKINTILKNKFNIYFNNYKHFNNY